MKKAFIRCLPLILIFSEICCLNKEVYEDSDDYEFDFKNMKDVNKKSDFNLRLTVLNNTAINRKAEQKASPTDYDNYKDYQPFDDMSGTDAIKPEMVVHYNKGNQKLMAQTNRQMKSTATTGSITTSISTALPLEQTTTGSTGMKILKIDTTTVKPLVKSDANKTDGSANKNESLIALAKTTAPFYTSTDGTNITEKITNETINGHQNNFTEPDTLNTIDVTTLTPPQHMDIIPNITTITTERSEEEAISSFATQKSESKMDPKFAALLEDSDEDDITLPPFFGSGNKNGADLYMQSQPSITQRGPTNSRRDNYRLKTTLPNFPKSVMSPQSPLSPLSPYPIFPIMPPKLPDTPGFQTIWVPIQVRRDSHSIDEMWKRSKTPNFIERGHIKHEPRLIDGTPNSWWRRERPKYCFEPIVVDFFCADRQPLKKWSYNEADERCYRYIDYCSANKLNSFDSLQDCLVSCWRARL